MGDNFSEGAEMFFKGWGLFVGTAILIGFGLYNVRPLRSEMKTSWNYWNFMYDKYKTRAEEKYFYNWGKQNPFGIGKKET